MLGQLKVKIATLLNQSNFLLHGGTYLKFKEEPLPSPSYMPVAKLSVVYTPSAQIYISLLLKLAIVSLTVVHIYS